MRSTFKGPPPLPGCWLATVTVTWGNPLCISLEEGFFNNLTYLFVYGCAGSLLLCGPSSSCGDQGLPFLAAQASRGGGFSCCRAQALGSRASAVTASGL